MNCGPLSYTGLNGLPLIVAAILAICLVVGGVVLVRLRKRRRGTGLVVTVALLVVATLGIGTLGATPAVAAACPTPTPTSVSSLTISQTAVIAGLEPGSAPVAIHGTVTNNSDDDTYIDDIEVSIAAVTLAPGAVGTCGIADFVLLDPVMSVDAPLAPHATVPFAGASIGLVDAPWNQDACQDATVDLRYVTA